MDKPLQASKAQFPGNVAGAVLPAGWLPWRIACGGWIQIFCNATFFWPVIHCASVRCLSAALIE